MIRLMCPQIASQGLASTWRWWCRHKASHSLQATACWDWSGGDPGCNYSMGDLVNAGVMTPQRCSDVRPSELLARTAIRKGE